MKSDQLVAGLILGLLPQTMAKTNQIKGDMELTPWDFTPTYGLNHVPYPAVPDDKDASQERPQELKVQQETPNIPERSLISGSENTKPTPSHVTKNAAPKEVGIKLPPQKYDGRVVVLDSESLHGSSMERSKKGVWFY